MATFDQLKELFMNQEEKDRMRREKEKEEEEKKRKEDKEEVKAVIKSHMSSIKEDIKEIKAKQDEIEGQVVESESKMEKKYDDIASKFSDLEKKINDIEERQKKKEGEYAWPAIQPGGRVESSNQLKIQPVGRDRPSSQPSSQGTAKYNKEIYSVVRRARKIVGFSPITDNNIKEVMEDLQVEDLEVGKQEVIKDFLRAEMAMPNDVIDQLKFARIFRRAGGTRQEDDKLYVEFSEDNMPAIIFKFVRKMRKDCNILTFIPDAFRERAAELEKAAFEMRHMTPSYRTKIRWGWGDLLLERKIRGSNEQFRLVNLTDLPPVDLSATLKERLPNPTSSPAPGRKKRSNLQESTSQYFQ